MSLKKSTGNMYPWVTHTHSHLAGECPHHCPYCYVGRNRFGRPARYTGPIRLVEAELKVRYGEGRTIFVDNCGDLWADAVPRAYQELVLQHCRKWPGNTYVFQTKNPKRYLGCLDLFPTGSILGCTIETNRKFGVLKWLGDAPVPYERANALLAPALSLFGFDLFITIEPIMDFDLEEFLAWIVKIAPAFVNIGADSKHCGLPEPSAEKVRGLIRGLQKAGIEIREKHNLDRLLR